MKIRKKEEEFSRRKNKKTKLKCKRKNNSSMKLKNWKRESKLSQSNKLSTLALVCLSK